MAARKPELREQARALRQQGWSLRRIAYEMSAALSTASRWVRDVPVPVTPPLPVGAGGSGRGDAQVELARRRCGRCLRNLPLSSFNRHRSNYQWWCRDCFRAYFRARAEAHRQQVRQSRQMRRQSARAFVSDYLQTQSCADCGEVDPDVLEFHHVQEKRGNVADLVNAGSSVRSLRRELEKCIVICANCHRVRTAASRGSWRLDPAGLDQGIHLTPGERRNMVCLRELLAQSQCVDCGESRLVTLEFDHVGTKTANVTELARRGVSLRRLQLEISECEVRCANCHRRRTALL